MATRTYKKPSPMAEAYVLGDRQTLLLEPADAQGRRTIWLRVDKQGTRNYGKPMNMGTWHEALQLFVIRRVRSKHHYRKGNGYCISYALLAGLEKLGVHTIRVDEVDDTVKVYGRNKRAVYTVPLKWWRDRGNAVNEKNDERQVVLPRPAMEHYTASEE